MMMIKDQSKFYKILIGYWLGIPIIFLIYAGLTSAKQSVDFNTLLTTSPTFSLGFLLSCVMIVMGLMLLKIDKRDISRNSILGKFLLFSVVQQIMTFNIVGVILCSMTLYSLPVTNTKPENLSVLTKISMGVILLLSLFMLLISFNIFNK